MSVTIVVLAFASLGLFAAFFAQFSANILRQRRIAVQDEHFREKALAFNRRTAQLARLESQIVTTQNSTSAKAWRVMEVREIEQESADCRSFYLVDPHGEDLPPFLPGQYVLIQPTVTSSQQLTRCYSLSDAPQKKYWRITVKKQLTNSAGRIGSSGLSAWLHDRIGVGDCVRVKGPAGQFHLPSDVESPLVLLAAGVGITPIISMLRWSLEHTPNRPVLVMFQAQDENYWPFGKQLHGWQAQCRCLRVVSYFSRKNCSQSIEHTDEFRCGKFGAPDIVELFDSWQSSNYFLCGPDSWMATLRNNLVTRGVMESQIHWESFGGAPARLDDLTPASASQRNSAAPRKVKFSISQVATEWAELDQTLWELAKSNDVEIASGCLSGACGSCKVRLLKGSVEYLRAATAEMGNDECLTCIARPTSDLVLEA